MNIFSRLFALVAPSLLPSPAQIGHRFSFSPSVGSFSPSAGSLWGTPMAPGAICNDNQQDKLSHLWIKHFSVPLIWSNVAHQSFWKTAISHLKPESCETNSFLQERVMMLRVCLNANQCLSFVSCELKHWAKSSAHVWHNTHWTQEESHWQWQPNKSWHKSTLMNLMPSYPKNINFGAEPQPIFLVYMLEKKVQTKQQIFNKTDVPSFRLLQLLCYNTRQLPFSFLSLGVLLLVLFTYIKWLHKLNVHGKISPKNC